MNIPTYGRTANDSIEFDLRLKICERDDLKVLFFFNIPAGDADISRELHITTRLPSSKLEYKFFFSKNLLSKT